MTTRIEIDLNVRVRGRDTYAGFEDVQGGGLPQVNDYVTVFEGETGLEGNGRVTEIDDERALIYLAVDWSSLAEPAAGQDDVASGLVRFLTAARLVPGAQPTTAPAGSFTAQSDPPVACPM